LKAIWRNTASSFPAWRGFVTLRTAPARSGAVEVKKLFDYLVAILDLQGAVVFKPS
jgi:hypothetical protein